MLLEPAGEALVQLRTARLRERLVRRVAHEQMPEAKGVLGRQLRLVGADQRLADESGQAWRHLARIRQRLYRAAVKDLALDGAALEHLPLGPVELVEASVEERLQRRGHRDLAVALGSHCDHLLDEEWIAAGGVSDPIPQLRPDGVRDQVLDAPLGQRLQPHRHGPLRPVLEQLRPGHADEENRSARREQGDVVDQVEQGLLCPVHVVEHAGERRLCLQQLPDRPGDLVRRRGGIGFAEQRPDRGRRGPIGRPRTELLHDLDDRPVGDPRVRRGGSARARRAPRASRAPLRRVATYRRRHPRAR